MQELLKKIKADAAARLPLPPGRLPTQELPRYKGYLKLEAHRLKMLHRAGAGGLEICQGRAATLDLLLQHLWDAAKATLSAEGQKEFPALALVALGGYGRGELNPHSDIDFMFLHHRQVVANKPLPYLAKIIDGMLYPLWDIGLKVGHSVRTPAECAKTANSDMQAKTSLIEARLIAGDEKLFKTFQALLVAKCVEGHVEAYLRARIADQASRRAKYGNSACMQEPNLKNACGGLRDFQNLLWMAFFKYRTRSLQDLQAKDFISESERKQLQAAYDFLLRTRTEMHYHTNRPTDVLGKNLQPAVAHNLGYRERSLSKRIERFMRDIYVHSRNIFLITRTLEQRLMLLPGEPGRLAKLRALLPRRRKAPAEPMDGFRFEDGEIKAVSNRIFRDQPRRLMRAFLHAQQRGMRLHPDLAQLIRNQLSLVDRAFLSDEHVRETFLTILNQRGNVAPILRAMHEVDLLGKYIPEFGKLTCLVQHEFYHQYAADEHTLMCIEQLDRIWVAKEPLCQAYSQLFHGLERPFVLYLALLLHDVGKPQGHGRHSQVGGELALRVARRLGLDGSATHALRLVIEHHLLLAIVSQRRDLDDPAVIRQVAKELQTPETVALLTLHTFVDARATSDKLWNGFKDTLLWSLHHKAMQLMSGGTEFVRVEEKQREILLEEVRRLAPTEISEEEVLAHFANLPGRYFQIHSAREVLEGLLLMNRFMRAQIAADANGLAPVVGWQAEPDRGYSAAIVCTWDRPALFSKIAGSFSASGLSILSAQIFTRADSIALDTFFVVDAKTGAPANDEQQARFKTVLEQALTGEDVNFHALIERHKITRPLYYAYTGEKIPTRVHFDNEASETRTLMELDTEDRVGLLYAVSACLAQLDVDISSAKILTEKGAAMDTFYVTEKDGAKLLAGERQKAVERKLRHALRALE
jgi:[protein-PII] uridylyltransferase